MAWRRKIKFIKKAPTYGWGRFSRHEILKLCEKILRAGLLALAQAEGAALGYWMGF
ncbi:hypothetical protein KAT92_03050 [Candidatus Babeliales bacterium]|nr:hypothetical protein [Candidatus Babeliales bacterium]